MTIMGFFLNFTADSVGHHVPLLPQVDLDSLLMIASC